MLPLKNKKLRLWKHNMRMKMWKSRKKIGWKIILSVKRSKTTRKKSFTPTFFFRAKTPNIGEFLAVLSAVLPAVSWTLTIVLGSALWHCTVDPQSTYGRVYCGLAGPNDHEKLIGRGQCAKGTFSYIILFTRQKRGVSYKILLNAKWPWSLRPSLVLNCHKIVIFLSEISQYCQFS